MGVNVVLVLIGVIALEAGLLWFVIRHNKRLRKESEVAERAIEQANTQLGRGTRLMDERIESQKEAAREKQRVEAMDESDLARDANSLFPDGVSHDKGR